VAGEQTLAAPAQTAKANSLEPYAYLRCLFTSLLPLIGAASGPEESAKFRTRVEPFQLANQRFYFRQGIATSAGAMVRARKDKTASG
jgi:hypothetical protein